MNLPEASSRTTPAPKNSKEKNKYIAAILAYMFGGFGIHRFYLGDNGMGILYLIFCWTFIPLIVSFFEVFYFLFMSDEAFDARYNLSRQLPAPARAPALPPGRVLVDGVVMSAQPGYSDGYGYDSGSPNGYYGAAGGPRASYEGVDGTVGSAPTARAGYPGQPTNSGIDGAAGRPSGGAGQGGYGQAPPPTVGDIREELEHLNELRLQGIISEEEFLEQKQRIWAQLG